MHSKFARVIIDRAIRRELDYAVPESLSARVGVGTRVRVPFRDRRALATVVALLGGHWRRPYLKRTAA
jgi:primosomal protein N'